LSSLLSWPAVQVDGREHNDLQGLGELLFKVAGMHLQPDAGLLEGVFVQAPHHVAQGAEGAPDQHGHCQQEHPMATGRRLE
jgi:hypothetical protein